jgi:hypothetical protein
MVASMGESPVLAEANVYGVDQPVALVDRYVVRAGCQQRVYDRVVGDYTAHLAARGLRLAGAWLSPPFEQPGRTSELTVVWEYPSLGSLWGARMEEESDLVARQLWADLDGLIESRSRHLGRSGPMDVPAPAEDAVVPAADGVVRRILVIHPAEPVSDPGPWVAAAAAVIGGDGVKASCLGLHGAYSFRPGDLTWDIAAGRALDDASCLSWLPGAATIVDAVTLGRVLAAGVRSPELAGIKRTILLRVRADAEASVVAGFEKTLAGVPLWITDIRNWRLSRVVADGRTTWTHCFEQEVEESAVFVGSYLHHPYHWAVVERLFHPDAPERVSDGFFQTLYPIQRSVLAAI